MKRGHRSILTLSISLLLLTGIVAYGQIHRYYSPGTIWTVTTIRIKSGIDQAYLEYLDGQFKRETDAQVQVGYMKSYKILQAIDEDTTSWDLIILREYASLADLERNEEKADAKSREVSGDAQQQMKGYEDRSRIREVLSTKTVRELRLKQLNDISGLFDPELRVCDLATYSSGPDKGCRAYEDGMIGHKTVYGEPQNSCTWAGHAGGMLQTE